MEGLWGHLKPALSGSRLTLGQTSLLPADSLPAPAVGRVLSRQSAYLRFNSFSSTNRAGVAMLCALHCSSSSTSGTVCDSLRGPSSCGVPSSSGNQPDTGFHYDFCARDARPSSAALAVFGSTKHGALGTNGSLDGTANGATCRNRLASFTRCRS